LPDISTINGVDITTLASFGGVAFADGQTVDGQNVALSNESHVFIDTTGAISSGTSSVSFTSGFSSTYHSYEFHFINVATGYGGMEFQVNAAGQSGFNEPIVSYGRYAYHNESDTGYSIGFSSVGSGQGQTSGATGKTDYVQINVDQEYNSSDAAAAGYLKIYNPTSTTYAKYFELRTVVMSYHPGVWETTAFGYINTTSAIDEIQFRARSTYTFSSGEIRMYGIKA